MKVALTGATGFIGGEVLKQCLECSSITSVIVLSRRELDASVMQANPKLRVVIMKDFARYPKEVLRELDGAEACIWSLGKAVVSTDEEARRISFDYTLAAAKAFEQISTRRNTEKFRFVYLSGRIAERDQSKPLWYMQEHRRIRGELENKLISFARDHSETFESYIMKPSMVLAEEPTLGQWLCSKLIATVGVDTLASAMIKTATEGSGQQTLENSDMAI